MSSSSIPKTHKTWKLHGADGFDSLKYDTNAPMPEMSDNEVLVKFHAASLNFRDLAIPKGLYPFPLKDGKTPGSDGAGEVVAVGSKVTRFQPGAKVVTLFNQLHLSTTITPAAVHSGLGGTRDGVLAQYGVFNEHGLVSMPSNLSYEEASTLPCAALTAWNALYGLKPVLPGQVVVTQGTGGVSIFALQFAKAAGATVIATTSSASKADVLKKLGADHIINYKEVPNWGEKAKALTPNGEGAHHVVEVGGAPTMAQSLKAIRLDGVISVIGFIAGQAEKEPSFLEVLSNICVVRGIFVGSRNQMEDMNRAIEALNVKPVVDKKIFALDDLKEAYQYMWDQKHFGKLVIKID